MVSKNLRDWDTELSHAEFAYNGAPSVLSVILPLGSAMALIISSPLILFPLLKN